MVRTCFNLPMQTVCCSFAALLCLLFSASGCGAAPEASTGSVSTNAPAAQATSSEVDPLAKPQGKLSAALVQLAQPAIATQNAEQQAQAIGKPATGAGSLQRNDQGQVLVTVRVANTTDVTQTALRGIGATIVNVAANYRTITLYIAPERLHDLAGLPIVENVREEIRSS